MHPQMLRMNKLIMRFMYVDLQYLFDRISRVNVVLLLEEFNTVDICKNGLGKMNDIGLCHASSGLPKI